MHIQKKNPKKKWRRPAHQLCCVFLWGRLPSYSWVTGGGLCYLSPPPLSPSPPRRTHGRINFYKLSDIVTTRDVHLKINKKKTFFWMCIIVETSWFRWYNILRVDFVCELHKVRWHTNIQTHRQTELHITVQPGHWAVVWAGENLVLKLHHLLGEEGDYRKGCRQGRGGGLKLAKKYDVI